MKTMLIILVSLSLNFGSAQTNSEQREIDFLNRLKEKESAREYEQQNLDLLIELYEAVDNIQAVRKFHYENRYNKEYLEQYKKKLLYGLSEKHTWESDEALYTKKMIEMIQLYNEQYQRCILNYVWAKKFPRNISKAFEVNKLPF